MKIAVMQPYLFPYIGYFQLMNAADKFVVYDDVNFINKGWINRNNILVNGKANLFTVPLNKPSQNKLIKDTEISDDESWKLKLLKTIEQSYTKAPYLKKAFPLVAEIIRNPERNISIFICKSFSLISSYLDIETKIIESSSVYLNSGLKQQERIIDICVKEKASTYLNPAGGIDLYSKEFFLSKSIKLKFIKPKEIRYKQYSNDFVSNLSIIDVLMFNDSKKVKTYLKEFELI